MLTTRRQWMNTAAGAAAAACVGQAQAARRPNVLLIMSDDQGYGDLSSHGNKDLQTPHLDRLATEGAEFNRFYVSPVCAPTRAALLTGRYNVRCGVYGVTAGRETMTTEEVTSAEALRAAGYRTALIGKWHLGDAYPNVPHGQGFEDYIGFRSGHWPNYYDTVLEHNGKPFQTRGYIADALTDEGIRYIERNRANPFFLYMAYNTPHTPYQVPDKYWQRFQAKGMKMELAAIYGMVENLDENIGRLLGRLGQMGLADNTIVIFLTDNGPNGDRYTCGLRGRKGSHYEGGVRVPFFLRWPGRVKAGRKVDRIAGHIDVYPTLADLCGVERPKGPSLDGMSLRPLLEGKEEGWPDRALFTHREAPGRETNIYPGTIRTQRFNLVDGKELYEIPVDPGEQNNVAGKYPEVVRRLKGLYEDWFQTALAERGFRRLPLPVGYAEENPVTLPAPQSYFSGSIKFHGGSGFAHDYLSGWSNVEDSVYWDIDVVRAGDYDVTLEYRCAAADTGSEIAVGAAGTEVKAKVARATPMEPLPDRHLVPQGRNLNLHWAELPAGSLALPKGRTRLTVRALSKSGATVMELRAAMLRRRE